MDSLGRLFGALRPIRLTSLDGRVHLRPWTDDDADFLIASYNDEQVAINTPLDLPIDLRIAQHWIRDHAARGDRPFAPALVITDNASTRCGAIGTTSIDWSLSRAELFYWVLAAHRGHGLATSALRTLTDWGFQHGLRRLELMIDTSNAPSIKVALAGGYHFERIHIGYRYLHGQLIDAAAYTRLA